jgi:predicted RNA-binding Zn-ribbon protein involved in translation (DUF1610 family)
VTLRELAAKIVRAAQQRELATHPEATRCPNCGDLFVHIHRCTEEPRL